MRSSANYFLVALLLAVAVCAVQPAWAQSYGVELGNTLMPASGGMAGTSVARPQDLLSGINANPAALSQFRGTQFTLGGAFAGSTFNIEQSGAAPGIGVTPFSAKSSTPGTIIPNIGVSQELSAYDLPVTFGIGLIGAAGAGTSFLKQPESNGTSNYLLILDFAPSIAVKLTDRLSVGTTMFVGDAYMSGPFVGVGSMTNALALRAGVGTSYELTDATTLGFYWQSRQTFKFRDEVVLFQQTLPQDVSLGLPDQIGLGISNSSLMNGRLLLAADALYLQWKTAALFQDIYRNQWVMQLGAQYRVSRRVRLRAGYALAQNPIDPNTGTMVAGIPVPGGIPAVKYLQSQFGVVNANRMALGVGFNDVLPGIDFDFLAGGMFRAGEQYGALTTATVESYWLGAGLTWRYGRGAAN
jgi:long-chain fatty acid transport protein